jgi:uncharacterized protein (TIGR02246 family)
MTSLPQAREREFYVEAVLERYFAAMDRGDVETTVAGFAEDATLACETTGMRLRGRDEIRAFFTGLTQNTNGMEHAPMSLVVDVEGRKVAAELAYTNSRKTGPELDMENCNVFEFDADGRLSRVRYWTGKPV